MCEMPGSRRRDMRPAASQLNNSPGRDRLISQKVFHLELITTRQQVTPTTVVFSAGGPMHRSTTHACMFKKRALTLDLVASSSTVACQEKEFESRLGRRGRRTTVTSETQLHAVVIFSLLESIDRHERWPAAGRIHTTVVHQYPSSIPTYLS